MPEDTIVESWRDMTARSCSLTRCRKSSLISLELCLSEISRTTMPRDLSWSATACLDSASTSPRARAPAMSMALNTYVLIARLSYAAREVAPSRRRSSAGVDERDSASRWLILPARTSAASAASIVCMPGGAARLQDGRDLVGLALADEVADRRRGHEHLAGADPPGAIGGGQQLLRHDALQRDRQLHADLVLLAAGEGVDDAVDRLRGVLGVQRREHEVAGLRRGQGGRDRLDVAHLADEDDVGVLAQRPLERKGEALGVGAELALVDEAALVGVQELDRVLDRHDVLVARLVDLVDDGRERGRLPGAGRAGHEHEAARATRQLVHHRRQAELVDRLQLGGDETEGGADRRALVVRVDAEAGETGDRIREVDLPVGLQPLALVVAEDRVHDLTGHRGVELGKSLERRQPASDADRGRRARGDVKVGRVAFHHLREHLGEIKRHIPPHRPARCRGPCPGPAGGRTYDGTGGCGGRPLDKRSCTTTGRPRRRGGDVLSWCRRRARPRRSRCGPA